MLKKLLQLKTKGAHKTVKWDNRAAAVQQLVFHARYADRAVNSFEPTAKSQTAVRKDGIVYVNDIDYGSKYPNGFADIWYHADSCRVRGQRGEDAEQSEQSPTIVYFHGGGFLFGDKVEGDPLAADCSGMGVLGDLVKQGYNVVSANYAFAPDYRFPVQIAQVDELMKYLYKNQQALNLNMNQVVLMGGSAGADMISIYGLVLTDEDYAKKLGIAPSIPKDIVKVLAIDEAALSPDSFNFNDDMNTMLGSWVGEDDMADSETVKLMNVAANIKKAYIPSFVNTSNMESWFMDSAKDMVAALERVGTVHEYFYRGQEFEDLEHGYMNRFEISACARECYEHMLAFMSRFVTLPKGDHKNNLGGGN